MRRTLCITAALLAISNSAQAEDINLSFPGLLFPSQNDFLAISEDMGAAYSHKPLNPAEPLGIIGFDIGVAASYTATENPEAWGRATGEEIDALYNIGLMVSKGLPFGLGVSGFYTEDPDSGVNIIGGAATFALEEGSFITPAVALRGGYTRIGGIDDFEFETYSVDLAMSKGFAVLTPYVGIGQVFVKSNPDGNIALEEEEFSDTKVYGGVRIALGVQLVAEVDQTGAATSYNVRVGFGF